MTLSAVSTLRSRPTRAVPSWLSRAATRASAERGGQFSSNPASRRSIARQNVVSDIRLPSAHFGECNQKLIDTVDAGMNRQAFPKLLNDEGGGPSVSLHALWAAQADITARTTVRAESRSIHSRTWFQSSWKYLRSSGCAGLDLSLRKISCSADATPGGGWPP